MVITNSVWISKQKFEGYDAANSFKCDICGIDRYCARVEFYLPYSNSNYGVRNYKVCVFCVDAMKQAIWQDLSKEKS
jgi:hypothetical protein